MDDFVAEEVIEGESRMQKLAARAAQTESIFLEILRYSVLTIAAISLLATAMYLAFGATQQIGQTEVEAEPVALVSADLVPETQPEASRASSKPEVSKPGVSNAVRKATASLYRRKFKEFQRQDAKIDEKQIVDFVWSEDRISAFAELSGRLTNAGSQPLMDDESVMLDALALTASAAEAKEFKTRLAAFRDAKKVNVCNDEVRNRRRTVTAWDSYSTNCPYWYESPIGCSTTRTVSEPYVEKICKLQYPGDIEEPAEQMARSIEQYAIVAVSKLDSAEIRAEEATAQNHARKADGHKKIETSGKLFLAFLSLMFLYLFVAMERHHRSLRRLLDQNVTRGSAA